MSHRFRVRQTLMMWLRNGTTRAVAHRDELHAVARLEPLEQRMLLSADGGIEVLPVPDPYLLEQIEAETSPAAAQADGVIDLTQTFALHSNPGATRVVYLDFDGHVTEGTRWNTSRGISQIVTPAYDIDGNRSSFSDAELLNIQHIWQRVTEDFIPFDIDVTTEDPGVENLRKTASTDLHYGQRVAIGGSSYDWYGVAAGGVAYIYSFDDSVDTPTFVWEEQLGNGHEKYTADAASHEVGHTLGLFHDGTSTTQYYAGHADWAPIMGVAYGKPLAHWSMATYPDAQNFEDDLHTITFFSGVSYRADDNAAAMADAPALSTSGLNVSGSGLIERNTDDDLFSFHTASGDVRLEATPSGRGPNLDIMLELLDASANVLAVADPATGLGAVLAATVNAGTYYLRVSGVGRGDPLVDGYSDYGSLGQYEIHGEVQVSEPTVSIYDGSAGENDGPVQFLVRLDQPVANDVVVNWTTRDDTATGGLDYVAASGQVLIPAGEVQRPIYIQVLNDGAVEAWEKFHVDLTSADVLIRDGSGEGLIVDNDSPIAVYLQPTYGASEGTGRKARNYIQAYVSTLRVPDEPITVSWRTVANGTATPGVDYQAGSGTLVLDPALVLQSIAIPLYADSAVEPDETFQIELTAVSGNAYLWTGKTIAVATIYNDDDGSTKGGGGGGGGGKGGGKKSSRLTGAPGRLDGATLAALLDEQLEITAGSSDMAAAHGDDLARLLRGEAAVVDILSNVARKRKSA